MKGIVDASFLLTLLPGHQRQEELLMAFPAIRGAIDLAAPPLLSLEIANAVHGRRRATLGRSFSDRRALCRLLLQGIDVVPQTDQAVERAAELAERHSLMIYDAVYLAAAMGLQDSVLLTEDRQLLVSARLALGDDRALDVPAVIERFGDRPPPMHG